MMATSPVKLACDPKRRKLDINFKRCVICQKRWKAKVEARFQKSFLRALKFRNDSDDCIEYNRLITVLKIMI